MTQAERCSLFLLDHKHNELIAKVFDGDIIVKADDKDEAVKTSSDETTPGETSTNAKGSNSNSHNNISKSRKSSSEVSYAMISLY